jgi:hypothetical protein
LNLCSIIPNVFDGFHSVETWLAQERSCMYQSMIFGIPFPGAPLASTLAVLGLAHICPTCVHVGWIGRKEFKFRFFPMNVSKVWIRTLMEMVW